MQAWWTEDNSLKNINLTVQKALSGSVQPTYICILFLVLNWLVNQVLCWIITTNNDLCIYYKRLCFSCENNCFQTAIAGAFVDIRNVLFCESALWLRVWMNTRALRDVHLAWFWVRIKHQLMHRLSCLFELKSIFIHTGSSMRTHFPEK